MPLTFPNTTVTAPYRDFSGRFDCGSSGSMPAVANLERKPDGHGTLP
jgi:hypothetical protein